MKRIVTIESCFARDAQVFTGDPKKLEVDCDWGNDYVDMKYTTLYIGIYEGDNEDDIRDKAANDVGVHPDILTLKNVEYNNSVSETDNSNLINDILGRRNHQMKNKLPSKKVVDRLRESYPAGTRVVLISIEDDPYSTLKLGDKGTVMFVDDSGTTHISWDCGSSLGLIHNIDFFALETVQTFETGKEMWSEIVKTHDKYGASVICGYYLERYMQKELSDNESPFYKGLFSAMYEDTTEILSKYALVYPYDFEIAERLCEVRCYSNSRIYNNECIRAIDIAIKKSCYKTNYYNLDIAAMRTVAYYGFSRVMMALARWVQRNSHDGRFSEANKQWAETIDIPLNVFDGTPLKSHANLIDSFITNIRNLYAEVTANRFDLPGKAESGQHESGYDIIRSITFANNQGFAIGQCTEDDNMFVCWQFTVINSIRSNFKCIEYGNEKTVANKYLTQVIVFLNKRDTSEIVR